MIEHDPGCPLAGIGEHSDAARHASDAVQLHVAAIGFEAVGKWVAVRLMDGHSDGTLYDSKGAAVRHQLFENLCAYVRVSPAGMNPCAAESYLATHRKLYKAGFRLADPDRQVIPRLTRRDQVAALASLRR